MVTRSLFSCTTTLHACTGSLELFINFENKKLMNVCEIHVKEVAEYNTIVKKKLGSLELLNECNIFSIFYRIKEFRDQS